MGGVPGSSATSDRPQACTGKAFLHLKDAPHLGSQLVLTPRCMLQAHSFDAGQRSLPCLDHAGACRCSLLCKVPDGLARTVELILTCVGGGCSIVYDMNKREETFEWFDIQNSEPEDCRVGKERIDLSELAKAPTLPKTPAPRALVSGVGPSSSKFHQRP